jgi:hypothetical protein
MSGGCGIEGDSMNGQGVGGRQSTMHVCPCTARGVGGLYTLLMHAFTLPAAHADREHGMYCLAKSTLLQTAAAAARTCISHVLVEALEQDARVRGQQRQGQCDTCRQQPRTHKVTTCVGQKSCNSRTAPWRAWSSQLQRTMRGRQGASNHAAIVHSRGSCLPPLLRQGLRSMQESLASPIAGSHPRRAKSLGKSHSPQPSCKLSNAVVVTCQEQQAL